MRRFVEGCSTGLFSQAEPREGIQVVGDSWPSEEKAAQNMRSIHERHSVQMRGIGPRYSVEAQLAGMVQRKDRGRCWKMMKGRVENYLVRDRLLWKVWCYIHW
jgi:hypothetical protein